MRIFALWIKSEYHCFPQNEVTPMLRLKLMFEYGKKLALTSFGLLLVSISIAELRAQKYPDLVPFCHYGMAGPKFSFSKIGKSEKLDGFYDACFPASDGMAVFIRSNASADEYYGAIDLKGNRVIKPLFNEIGTFCEGLAPARLPGGQYGFINHCGAWVLPQKWTSASEFRNGHSVVGSGDQFGLIDKTGNMVVPQIYEEFFWPSGRMEKEPFAVIKDKGRGWGLLSLTSFTESVRCNWEEIRFNLSSGLVPVKKNSKWGFTDLKGKLVIPCIYENTEGFSEGLASVILNGKSGYINTRGKVVVPIEYYYAGFFQEGVGAVYNRVEGKWSWVDSTGNVLQEFKSEEINLFGNFSEGRIRFAKRDENGKHKWGFMDHHGKIVIQPIYGECTDFAWGRACVTGTSPYNNVLWGLIDRNGAAVTKIKYSRLYPMMGYEGILWYCEGGKSLISTPVIDREGVEYFTSRAE